MNRYMGVNCSTTTTHQCRQQLSKAWQDFNVRGCLLNCMFLMYDLVKSGSLIAGIHNKVFGFCEVFVFLNFVCPLDSACIDRVSASLHIAVDISDGTQW